MSGAGAGAGRGRTGEAGAIRSGGGSATAHLAGLGARSSKVVALFSGIVALDNDGQATIPVEVPDFSGRLRLMAIAFNATAIGAADIDMIVRDPVVAELSLPRFLAPGDKAQATLSLDVVDGEDHGPLSISLISPQLFSGSRATMCFFSRFPMLMS